MSSKKTSKRMKTPVRWAIVIIGFVLTGTFFQTILDGPAPAHAAPTLVPVVQQAPTLDEMINQVESQASDNSGGGFNAVASSGPQFRTRGS